MRGPSRGGRPARDSEAGWAITESGDAGRRLIRAWRALGKRTLGRAESRAGGRVVAGGGGSGIFTACWQGYGGRQAGEQGLARSPKPAAEALDGLAAEEGVLLREAAGELLLRGGGRALLLPSRRRVLELQPAAVARQGPAAPRACARPGLRASPPSDRAPRGSRPWADCTVPAASFRKETMVRARDSLRRDIIGNAGRPSHRVGPWVDRPEVFHLLVQGKVAHLDLLDPIQLKLPRRSLLPQAPHLRLQGEDGTDGRLDVLSQLVCECTEALHLLERLQIGFN